MRVMYTVGALEAKTHFFELLEQVATGEQIAIEKRGVLVATLAPAAASKKEPAAKVIAALKEFRAGNRLDGLTIREMVEEGR